VLKRYDQRVRFEFRNLPLTQIHPLAMPAAVLTETAMAHGDFWPVHDALYSGVELGAGQIEVVRRRFAHFGFAAARDDKAVADETVRSDVLEAHRLGLDSTPSFVLCCPDGRSVCLGSPLSIVQWAK